MKKELFIKVTITHDKHKRYNKLVSVCAWCPKETYPELGEYEEYTHGLCERHYIELRENRKFDKS